MDDTNGTKDTTRVTAPVASNTLNVNVFTAPGKTMVGERPKPFGEPLGFDPITSTLIYGEYDAVLVDAMGQWLRLKLSRTGSLCTIATWRPST